MIPKSELVDKSNQSPSSGLMEILCNKFLPGDLLGNNPDMLLLAASSKKMFDQIGDEKYHSSVKYTFRENDQAVLIMKRTLGRRQVSARAIVVWLFSFVLVISQTFCTKIVYFKIHYSLKSQNGL